MLKVIIQSLFDVTIDKNITFLKSNFQNLQFRSFFNNLTNQKQD